MKKEMLINVLQPEECRIAIVEDGVLEELYVERTSHESYVGNIYKGRIVNIEPSIQAAFVDFGVGRNGFLHVSDVEPTYYRHLEQPRNGGGHRGRGGRDRHRGQPRPARQHRDFTDEIIFEDVANIDLGPEEMETPSDPAPDDLSTSESETSPRSEPERGPRSSRRRSRRGRGDGPTSQHVEPGEEWNPSSRDITQPESSPLEPQGPDRSETQDENPFEPDPRPDRESPPEREGPRFMNSAERRTEEGDSPVGPEEPKSSYGEADLFFPRSDPSSSGEPETPEVDHPQQPQPERVARSGDRATTAGSEDRATTESERQPEPVEEDWIEPFSSAPENMNEPEPSPEPIDEEVKGDFGDEFEEPMPRPHRRHPRDDRQRGRGGRRSFNRPGMGRPKPLIQDIFKRGQEVLVQVIKEGIGTKGPTLSTYISIAGRYLVLMPGLNRIGVSRKIADEDQRHRLRDVLSELQPPKGLGFIIRTAGLDRTKKELQRDLAYLSRLWQVVVRRIRKLKSPEVIYKESDMITRTIRDTFSSEIDTIWVDEPKHFEQAHEFLQMIMPRYANRIRQYADSEPLFHKYGIEEEIARIQLRHVPLPNGGSIVIDQTEALVAIDVNSGNFRADNNAEETAYRMNLLAAKEIARQLRLRDLGGVIVNDFIDMRDENHRRGVERALREAVKRDRARAKILKISAFGLIEMTRQRIRPSLKRSVYQDCPHCLGTGQVKTCESMSIDVMRMLQLAAHHKNVSSIQVKVAEEVAHYLHNKKRKEISKLEGEGSLQVTVSGVAGASPEHLDYACYDNNNNEVKLYPGEESKFRGR